VDVYTETIVLERDLSTVRNYLERRRQKLMKAFGDKSGSGNVDVVTSPRDYKVYRCRRNAFSLAHRRKMAAARQLRM